MKANFERWLQRDNSKVKVNKKVCIFDSNKNNIAKNVNCLNKNIVLEENVLDKEKLLQQYQAIYQEKKGFFHQMIEIHKKDPYTVNDNTKNNKKICFIFSCPGREELINGQVCCGDTGENLESLLKILNQTNTELFPSTNRYDYDLLNASNIVHFYALDRRTEAGTNEIQKQIQRVFDYIDSNNNLCYIILCGKKAERIKSKIEDYIKEQSLEITVIDGVPHLGYQSLNQIEKDINGKTINESSYPYSKTRTEARLYVVADKIKNAIALSKNKQ